jgi:hypothetical protein
VSVAIDEQQHVALPKLMGQPAYARPPRHVTMTTVRPLDPDDMPLEAFLDGDELEHARDLRSRPFVAVPAGMSGEQIVAEPPQRQRGFRLKLFGARSSSNGHTD